MCELILSKNELVITLPLSSTEVEILNRLVINKNVYDIFQYQLKSRVMKQLYCCYATYKDLIDKDL